MLVQELDDAAQGSFDVGIVRANCRDRDKVDRGGEFVGDPVIQLPQQGSIIQRG